MGRRTSNASALGKFVRRGLLGLLFLLLLSAAVIFGYLYWMGRKAPDTTGDYVALGSSFAAGIGIGGRAPGSPVQCMRTLGGYPSLVAQRSGLSLVDMSCSGSTTAHILQGGQMLLGTQLAAVGPDAKLVTITSGGNDVDYIGDMMAASGQMGRLGAWWAGPPQPVEARPFDMVSQNFEKIVAHIRKVAPKAKVVIVSYPAVLPVSGNCRATGISDQQAQISRDVAKRLAAITKQAAAKASAAYVDMATASVGHDACSSQPWTNGAIVEQGTAFHPNAAGAAAVAERVAAVMRP